MQKESEHFAYDVFQISFIQTINSHEYLSQNLIEYKGN